MNRMMLRINENAQSFSKNFCMKWNTLETLHCVCAYGWAHVQHRPKTIAKQQLNIIIEMIEIVACIPFVVPLSQHRMVGISQLHGHCCRCRCVSAKHFFHHRQRMYSVRSSLRVLRRLLRNSDEGMFEYFR